MATARHASNFTFVHRGPLAVPRARAKEPSCGRESPAGQRVDRGRCPRRGTVTLLRVPGRPHPRVPALPSAPARLFPQPPRERWGPSPHPHVPPPPAGPCCFPGRTPGRRGNGEAPTVWSPLWCLPPTPDVTDHATSTSGRKQTCGITAAGGGPPGRLARGRSSDLSAGPVGSTFQHVLPKAPAGAEPEGWGGVLPRP